MSVLPLEHRTASQPGASARGAPWLLSRRADILLFGGSAGAALALLLAGWLTGTLDGDAPPWLFVLAVVGVDVAHVWATGWRVYADGDEFGRRPVLYLAIPAAAYVGGVLAHTISPLLFWRLLAYTAVFHFVRQQYGWVALYRRKSGENDEPDGRISRAIDEVTIYGATIAPLVFWHANAPRRFSWFVAGDFVTGLPRAIGTISLLAFGAVLLVYAAKEIRRARHGLPVSWGKNLVVGTTILTWFLGIVVLNSDYAFTVLNVLVHGIPYFGFVWAASRQRASERAARRRVPTFADRAAANIALFLLPLLALAWTEEWGWDRFVWHDHGALFPGPPFEPGPLLLSLLVPLFALPQATHYLLDAWIWKVRPENREAVRAIGLEATQTPLPNAGGAR